MITSATFYQGQCDGLECFEASESRFSESAAIKQAISTGWQHDASRDRSLCPACVAKGVRMEDLA
jgi:hypothetical protein